ncbi:hypothetical protein J6590_066333 [Homalodisca vitripennis]|nr:hypothetical protein J6590_066333 [Homalodisca vitripennis]
MRTESNTGPCGIPKHSSQVYLLTCLRVSFDCEHARDVLINRQRHASRRSHSHSSRAGQGGAHTGRRPTREASESGTSDVSEFDIPLLQVTLPRSGTPGLICDEKWEQPTTDSVEDLVEVLTRNYRRRSLSQTKQAAHFGVLVSQQFMASCASSPLLVSEDHFWAIFPARCQRGELRLTQAERQRSLQTPTRRRDGQNVIKQLQLSCENMHRYFMPWRNHCLCRYNRVWRRGVPMVDLIAQRQEALRTPGYKVAAAVAQVVYQDLPENLSRF